MSLLCQWCLVVMLVMLGGCATIDFERPKSITTAFNDTQDTYLGQHFAGLADAHPGQSGFYPLVDGVDALALRLLMAKRAVRSIDAQYYLITGDIVGNMFVGALLEAADRGVRVRLLLDDIKTKGYDTGMAALESHPNFEIRIFNPFARRSARFFDGLTSFSRINRRMHNKSFTVDNQMTLIGGRNIGDEYFGAGKDAKFGDVDVAGVGPVVGEVSEMFDQYWNNRSAVPSSVFTKPLKDPAEELRLLRGRIKEAYQRAEKSNYASVLNSSIMDFVETDTSVLDWAPYQLAYDSPDKAQRRKAKGAATILTPLRQTVLSAEHELLVISPYFVPRKKGIAAFRKLRERGVDVRVITNSLAANNQPLVHGGYAPARKPLLDMGVRIYEARADASVAGEQEVDLEGVRATLHTKMFIVDRRKVFIGSFNWDPRSAYINTELGVIIESPKMAVDFTRIIDDALPVKAFEVFRNEQGSLRWKGMEDGREVVLSKEPQTGFFQRVKAHLMRVLPIRGQL